MRVVLHQGLFSEPADPETVLHLLAIFRLGFKKRHAVVLDFHRTEGGAFDAWLRRRPADEQDAIEGALRYGRQADARLVLDNVVLVAPVQQPRWNVNQWLSVRGQMTSRGTSSRGGSAFSTGAVFPA